MYQEWQNDPSRIDSVIKLIEERENREIHKQNYNPPPRNESGNWGIMSLRDVNTPTRPLYQDSSTSRGPGVPEVPRRRAPESPPPARRDQEPLGWRTGGRELAPVARFGLEIASRLTQQLKVGRGSSSSSEDDRRTSRSKRHQDSPEKRRKSERRRRSSRSGSEGRKRSRRSRSNSRPRRGRSGSRDKKRYRSRSRDRKRERSPERKRDRSTERNSGNKSPPSRERRDLPTATQAKQTAPQTVNDANDILSKFISIIKDVKEPAQVAQPQKFPYKDVLPEFDPIDKANAIVTWITRVDDIAKLFGWEEKDILQHAMPKLAGLAKVWYLGRKDFVHSWPEWKKKLVEQFPCPDFWQMLEELKQRVCDSDETLENYFHDKIILVKRCGIRGRQAVDCVLQGIAEEAVRLFAAAAQFDEPEELLRYLQTAESIRKRVPNVVTPPVVAPTPTATETPTNYNGKPHCSYCNKFGHLEITCHACIAADKKTKKSIPCPNCLNYGHEPSACWNNKPNQKHCFNCGKLGHTIKHCRLPKQGQNQKSKVQSQKSTVQSQKSTVQSQKSTVQSQIVEKVKKPKTCYTCGEVGHLKYACPKTTQQAGASQGPAPGSSAAAEAATPGSSQVGDVTTREPPPPGVEEH